MTWNDGMTVELFLFSHHPAEKTGTTGGIEPKNVSNVHNPVDIPLYWLFNRDPYNGFLQSPYNWVGCHPLYTTLNQGFGLLMWFRCCFWVVDDAPYVGNKNERKVGKRYHWPGGMTPTQPTVKWLQRSNDFKRIHFAGCNERDKSLQLFFLRRISPYGLTPCSLQKRRCISCNHTATTNIYSKPCEDLQKKLPFLTQFQQKTTQNTWLLVSTNLKNISQIGSFPQGSGRK